MNILIATGHFYGDQRGGAQRVAWDCARELRDRGHDVVLLCEGVGGAPASEHVEGVRLLRYHTAAGWNPYTRHHRAASALLKSELRDCAPNLVWGHAPFQFLAALQAFPRARRSYVVHSPLPLEMLSSHAEPGLALRLQSRIGRHLERRCLLRAGVVQVLSLYTRQLLLSLYGRGIEPKMRITPGWADTSFFRPVADRNLLRQELGWPATQETPVFFVLRRLVPRMGLDRLMDAAANLKERGINFRLYLGGEGPLRFSLDQQIARLQLSNQVKLLGGLSGEVLARGYAACDAFVVPTTALECFGLIAVEAMSAGAPVLSTPVGALPEIIAPVEPRWLARDNSAQALADLLRDFLRGLLPARSQRELHQYVEEKYSHKTALAKFCDTALEQWTI